LLEKEIILTPEGYRRLKEEIDYLSTKKRDEVAERIKESRYFGDISENSEYDDAKNEQAMLEQRIFALEEKLRSAIIIDEKAVSTDVVSIGAKVTLEDEDRGAILEYTVVGSAEADPSNHKLSNESPVGRAIMGKKPGDEVTVPVPQGAKRLKIVAIERA
jgi:transcription elongation factor GreA